MKIFIILMTLLIGAYFLISTHNPLIGKIDQFIHPGYGHCYKCGFTWASVKGHDTNYHIEDTLIKESKFYDCDGNEHSISISYVSQGMFPLCEYCWKRLTPEQRLPYYRECWEAWQRAGPQDALWQEIRRAVMEGK